MFYCYFVNTLYFLTFADLRPITLLVNSMLHFIVCCMCVHHMLIWKENWKLAQVVNFSPVDDSTIRQSGFELLIFHDNNGPCLTVSGLHRVTVVLVRRNGTRQPLICVCGEKLTMSHIVNSCPLSKLNGSLSQLHSADDEAVAWMICYGS